MVMRSRDEKDRGDLAREYLKRAREAADRLNEDADRHANLPFDPARERERAVMNALVAIAMVQVPDEPGSRLA
ncbi:hypothetical protein SEA_SATIS_174 [Streptomyces phage Satis]|nr:hypothetical protein SEA_SATIS_174 [Streptomyces phage Satis]QBZ72070.1 hypothetical protein SEA_KRADAL_174 [Streptomyces phage Kradal]QPL14490.1 hypothetical protein SEA_EHYELIMAYOE_175 [Streptomyces phage EhyElimayoE]